jgi:cell filamentation protein
MDRYQLSESDPYLIKGTECLINKLGITDINELEIAERNTTRNSINLVSIQEKPYSLATMKYIHTTLFSSLYPWAGEIRKVGIWKGDTRFCAPERIEAEALKLFNSINLDFQTKDKFWSLEEAADRLAYHYGELNVIHPFREGNGRTQRILFEFIAQDIGYSIRWQGDSDQWISANISAYTTDHKALSGIFLDILEPA